MMINIILLNDNVESRLLEQLLYLQKDSSLPSKYVVEFNSRINVSFWLSFSWAFGIRINSDVNWLIDKEWIRENLFLKLPILKNKREFIYLKGHLIFRYFCTKDRG
jgi:hypothetical protein